MSLEDVFLVFVHQSYFCFRLFDAVQVCILRVSRVISGLDVRISFRVKVFLAVSEMRDEVFNSFTKKSTGFGWIIITVLMTYSI